MKKIIYGMLVLIGGILIASNFNVDTNKLDHKKVSASGTACRWISDTGYGTGPLYYNGYTNDAYGAETMIKTGLRMVDCNLSNTGITLLSGAIYDENNNLLEGTFHDGKDRGSCKYSESYIIIEDGYIVARKTYQVAQCISKPLSYYDTPLGFKFAGTYDIISSTDNEIKYLDGNRYHGTISLVGVEPTKYTCVCAEY